MTRLLVVLLALGLTTACTPVKLGVGAAKTGVKATSAVVKTVL